MQCSQIGANNLPALKTWHDKTRASVSNDMCAVN